MATKKSNGKERVPENLPPNIPVGTPVCIIRPHLWSGCYGVVEKIDGVKHLVRVFGKGGADFHTECYSILLVQENNLWPEIEMI